MSTATKERKAEIVHFTIGDELGMRIMEIAQEHLTYGNDPVKALRAITDSLIGCPVDIAIKILKGELVLPVDIESQQVICQERIEGEHDRFPRINPLDFIERQSKSILMHGEYIKEGLLELQKMVRKGRGYYTINFNYEDVFKFACGNDEVLLEELRDNRDIDAIASLFEVTKRFIEQTMKTQATMKWMMETFDEFTKDENRETYLQLRDDVADTLSDINYELKQTTELRFTLDAPTDDVQSYIEAVQEIDKVIEKGIEPVDIMENWSAGWLSPDGDFYGLNGEYANMLHVQIADALMEKGLIPDDILNPDSWLEERGWVKIHGQFVHFCGCNNFRSGKKNVDMTAVQVKKVYEYISLCHNCIMKLGWKQQVITAPRFQLIAENNIEHLNKEYFEY